MSSFDRKSTYARELDAAVTALGGSASLLDVEDSQLAAGGLDDTSPVGRRVVAVGDRVSRSVEGMMVACFSITGRTYPLRRRYCTRLPAIVADLLGGRRREGWLNLQVPNHGGDEFPILLAIFVWA